MDTEQFLLLAFLQSTNTDRRHLCTQFFLNIRQNMHFSLTVGEGEKHPTLVEKKKKEHKPCIMQSQYEVIKAMVFSLHHLHLLPQVVILNITESTMLNRKTQ